MTEPRRALEVYFALQAIRLHQQLNALGSAVLQRVRRWFGRSRAAVSAEWLQENARSHMNNSTDVYTRWRSPKELEAMRPRVVEVAEARERMREARRA